jgi:succinoglycan biosynthesis transport protein ExoP
MGAAESTSGAAASEDLRDKLRGYWRRRITFFVTASVLFALTVLMAVLLPPTYRSTATILIEQQEIPQDLVRSAISSFADQRIQVISQRVMTTQNLLSLIDRYHLYPDLRLTRPREVLMQRMRDDIGMKMISADVIDPRSGHPTQATIAFSVSYQSQSPDLALKVANDLTSLYLNENLTSRTQLAEQTTAFFAEEASRQQARIVELDKALADFKEKHRDRLPELATINTQVSDRTELELRDAENHLSALDSQRILLEAQLAQISPTALIFSDTGQRVMNTEDRLKALKSQLAGFKARYAPGHPDIVAAQREVEGLEKEVKSEDGTSDLARRLNDARALLAQAQERYSPDHPDVIRLQRVVGELESAFAAQPASGNLLKEQAHADNPAYIQVRGQIDALMAERESAEMKRAELRTKLNDYEGRLTAAPAVERDYRALARDLDNAQLRYQQIRAKQSDAQISDQLETEKKGERFTMIEPPLPPEKPISPNRILILVMGIMLSLAMGLGAVVLKESVDPSIRGINDVRRLLSVPPLAAIPNIVTPAEARRQRRMARYSWQGAVAAVAGVGASIHFLVRPLDIVWFSLLRRFGM